MGFWGQLICSPQFHVFYYYFYYLGLVVCPALCPPLPPAVGVTCRNKRLFCFDISAVPPPAVLQSMTHRLVSSSDKRPGPSAGRGTAHPIVNGTLASRTFSLMRAPRHAMPYRFPRCVSPHRYQGNFCSRCPRSLCPYKYAFSLLTFTFFFFSFFSPCTLSTLLAYIQQ